MYAMYCNIKKKGLTREQKEALGYYRFLLLEEDRYMGSVFYIPGGSREKEMDRKRKEAIERCNKLGVGKYC